MEYRRLSLNGRITTRQRRLLSCSILALLLCSVCLLSNYGRVLELCNTTLFATTSSNGIMHHVFHPWNFQQNPFPCIPDEEETTAEDDTIIDSLPHLKIKKMASALDGVDPLLSGLLYMKIKKTASSTLAGVNLRIAHNVAKYTSRGKCNSKQDHDWFGKKGLQCHRDKDRSFLWTFLRDPTSRAVSEFYHLQVSRKGLEPTDANFQYYVRRYRISYLDMLSCGGASYYSDVSEDELQNAIRRILKEYNFIGVSERLDESLVVLQLILGLDKRDIMYMSAKTNGGYDEFCYYIKPPVVSQGMTQFFESDDWQKSIHSDVALYQAVNRTLDYTIDAIGRPKFDRALADFLEAKELVQSKCESETRFPCTNDGTKRPDNETNCYENDNGCGFPCMDQVLPRPGSFEFIV